MEFGNTQFTNENAATTTKEWEKCHSKNRLSDLFFFQ